jgi:Phosphotransferase enzyme family
MTTLIPQTREDITKELVEGLLRAKFPKIRVSSIEILREVHGTGANICLKVDHRGADKLPGLMWLKTGFPTVHLDRILSLSLYAREARFYSELQPLVNMRVPNCYAAVHDDASGRGVVLLEDMNQAGATFPGCINPWSVDQMASGLDLLADLHSRSWERAWIYNDKIGKFLTPGSALEDNFRYFTLEYIISCLEGPVGAVVPSAVRNAQQIYDAIWRLQPLYQCGPFCLLHGDAHPGNSFVTVNNEVGFLDWQVYVIGPWAHDFSYWLVGGLSIDDRRRFERELLERYLNRMSRNGVAGIDRNEAWDNYRRFIAYGYWIWVRVPPAQQPAGYNIAVSERFGAAMVDHHVFELLGL